MLKNILFICSQNKLRSPTAEAVFAGHEGWDVRSAGTNNNAEIPLGADDIEWADILIVMEQAHKKKVKQRFQRVLKGKRLICLGIPDNYTYMDEELIKILRFRVPKLID
ncbi:MAG: phosphotyrosine protein phosphatase [Kordiimonadales bacterium]|nr:MAG: phosphotyrosine protein phosphatase [Kordiimonadales bacterium]